MRPGASAATVAGAVSGIGTSAEVITIGNGTDALDEVAEGDDGDEGALVVVPDAHAVRATSRTVTTRVTFLGRELTPGLSPSWQLLLPMLRRNDSDSVSGEDARRARIFRGCPSCAA